MQIDELPGVERSDAAWWKLVAAMGVIRGLEKRVAQLEPSPSGETGEQYAMTRALYYVQMAQEGATIARLRAAEAILKSALTATEGADDA